MAGKANISNRALCAGADFHHFGDITEMVLPRLARLLAIGLRLIHHLHEIAPVMIVKQRRPVTGESILVAFRIKLANGLIHTKQSRSTSNS